MLLSFVDQVSEILMLGSVSKLADKTFIIGFFVPAVLAFFAVGYIFQSVPVIGGIGAALASDKSFTDLTYLAVTVWFSALLLLGFNYDCYRMLEGYVPPFAWFPNMTARHRRTLLRLRKQHDDLIAAGERAKASRISWRLNKDYPPSESNVLPTLFGNRIRAFELYSNDLYGADGVTLWPRLSTILPAQVESAINDAQAQVNLMMNICVWLRFWRLAQRFALSSSGLRCHKPVHPTSLSWPSRWSF